MKWLKNKDRKIVEWINIHYYSKSRKNDLVFFFKFRVLKFIFLRFLFFIIKYVKGEYREFIKTKAYKKNKPKRFIDLILYQRIVAGTGKFKQPAVSDFLRKKIVLPFSEKPSVSIIIAVYNKLEYTLQCLSSIAEHLKYRDDIEVIVINDASTDNTREILEKNVVGLRLINNEENLGFLLNSNKGASQAKGSYFYFLNNDTVIKKGTVEALVKVFEEDSKAGVVGSKLIYPNGLLQEAGGVIWKDASGLNYGKFHNADAPEYNYRREVDYCSGASILVKRDVFEKLNGFDVQFVPAYYEDTDLCFAVRNVLGMKVIYQPESVVVHYEGVTSGTSTSEGTKRYQDVNAVKFKNKWKAFLESHLPNTVENWPIGARRLCGKKNVVVIDSYVTRFDQESGSNRLFEIIKIFKAINLHVIFVPDNQRNEGPYGPILQELGVEVLYYYNRSNTNIFKQLTDRLPIINYAWICRPELNEKYVPLVKLNLGIKIIYDTIDIHFLRAKRKIELQLATRKERMTWEKNKDTEILMAKNADLTITVTDADRKMLLKEGVKNVEVVPNIHNPSKLEGKSFKDRKGLLFIGSYTHDPNEDAVKWLCHKIMPFVWKEDTSITVTLLGNKPTKEILALQNDKVTVKGYVKDVSPFFLSHKVFVAPLRYGSGMKGKIGQSLEYKLPIISTPIGAEGMRLVDDYNVLIADTPEMFAKQIVRVCNDEQLWSKLSANSIKAIEEYTSENVKRKLEDAFSHL